jgi:hypothetical protein
LGERQRQLRADACSRACAERGSEQVAGRVAPNAM